MNKLLLVMGMLMAAFSGAVASDPRLPSIPGLREILMTQEDFDEDTAQDNTTTQPGVVLAPLLIARGLEEAEEAPVNAGAPQQEVPIEMGLTPFPFPDDYQRVLQVRGGNPAILALALARHLHEYGFRPGEIQQTNVEGLTPLHVALIRSRRLGERNAYTGIAFMLIELGADVNVADPQGRTPLWIAARIGNRDAVDRLLRVRHFNPGGVNMRDREERTLLHVAVMGRNQETAQDRVSIARTLIFMRIDINALDNAGHTPLWYAVQTHNVGAVRMLMIHGARRNLDPIGNTPVDLANNIPEPDMWLEMQRALGLVF